MSNRRHMFSSNSGSKDVPEFNIAILGTMGVGKSALTVKYITKRFIMEYDPFLEDTYTKQENIDGQEVKVKLMDTCDKDGRSPDRYLKWAHGFVVVYSITDKDSFKDAKEYLETITQYQRITGKDIPIVLVGNKVDLERYRVVNSNTGNELATQFESTFLETSVAEDFISVEKVFHHVIKEIVRVQDRQIPLQSLFISEDKSGLLGSYRRTKSPRTQDVKDAKKERESEKVLPRKTITPFKLFNKNFKIFN